METARTQPAAPAGADLGILGGVAANDDNAQPSTSSTREQVYEALLEASLKGSFCAGGPADGTTTAPALPTTLGLRITGLGLPSGGDVPLPVTDALLKTIKAKATKVADKSFSNVYEVDRKKIRIQNPAWEASVAKLVKHCAYKLGVHPNNLTAELDRLLVMGRGGRIDRCSDVEENGDVLGTLLIQLPSKFAGETESDEEEEADEEEKTSAFSFDTPGDEFVCHFVCHFSDVEYEFSRVNSGSRVLLRYTLLHRGPHKPTAGLVRNSMEELEWSLAHLPPVESMVLFPLAKEYKDSALVNRGINALSHPHRVNAEAIMAAGEGWKLLVINAKLKYTHTSFGRDGDVSDSFNNASISGIFDERGIDVSSQMKWVKDVASFDCVSSDGMLLTSSKNGLWCDDIFYDDWGRCKHEKNSSTGDDSDDYGGYTYDRDVSHTTEKWYQSSFLLAYRLNADPELKASGGVRGTAEVAKQIVATHDYNLLKRLLSIVSANKKSELDIRSCHLLLQMLTEATDKGSSSAPRIEMANGIVLGLGRSFQPSSELYAILLSAIDRFGRVLADSVFKLWSEYDRLHNLELVGYLRRADFALKLNNRVGTVVDYVDAVVRALKRDNGAKVSNSGDINKVLLSLTGTHGWDKLNTVIKATLDSLHKTASKSIVDLLNRAILLSRVEASKQCSFIDGCTSDFAKTFVEGLASDYRDKALARLTGNDKGIFLQAIRYVLERGGSDEHLQFGNWAKSKQGRLSALLKALGGTENGVDPIQDILNKCLVHLSASKSGWPSQISGTVPDWTHVRFVLDTHPSMASKPDKDGRLTLHHAAESDTAPFDVVMDVFQANPKAARVPDPASGLYPFMIAASNDKDSLAYSLLLADPSLVLGGIPADAEDGKKRKRSPSMG